MSRTNPYKQKKRRANKTLLVFGEGLGEEVFLKHLRTLYTCDCNVRITIRKGKGGDAKSIVVDASRLPGAYDRIIVVLDNDKSMEEMNRARLEAKRCGIEMIENTPCLEFLLLSIMGVKVKGGSVLCKKEFEANYISKQRRGDVGRYNELFPKSVLDKRRSAIKVLDMLITIMEGR